MAVGTLQLSGLRKAAIRLVQLGRDRAAKVMSILPEQMVEDLEDTRQYLTGPALQGAETRKEHQRTCENLSAKAAEKGQAEAKSTVWKKITDEFVSFLDARSELNANPKDDRDHAFGVWTLPPVRRDSQDGRTLTAAERSAYDAIGESDRMTLRLRKPA